MTCRLVCVCRWIIWSHGRREAGRQLVRQECVVGWVVDW